MNSKGFSIVELIVTMAIVGIISTIVFANYKQMGRVSFLEDEANTLISGIEESRATALSAIEMERDGSQVQYFTITVENDKYILFEGTSEQREYSFEGGIEVIEGGGRAVGFRPPEPKVTFLDGDLENEILEDQKCIEFVLNYVQDPEEKDIIVRVNKAGLIQIADEKECS